MKLYIAGGGTAGHINPGLAIAGYVQEQCEGATIRFMGGKHGIESTLIPKAGYPLDTLDIIGLRRSMHPKAIVHNVKAMQKAMQSAQRAKKLLQSFQPDCVIGCGGYASFPAVYAAQKLGIPTILLEVNALPGKVTKKLAQKASAVLVCFEQTRTLLGNIPQIHVTGAPVRTEILRANREAARQALALGETKLVVSFWGSMGAKYMNEHMLHVLVKESAQGIGYRHIHATGTASFDAMHHALQSKGVDDGEQSNTQLVPYIYNMAQLLSAADLVVCRAGAGTLGELCALGCPSILIPSPYVAENHQEKNARALEAQGACKVLTEAQCTPEVLYQTMQEVLGDDALRSQMAQCAKQQAKRDALKQIYAHIQQVIGQAR